MPLIALDILENKLKELLLVISHLKGENSSLKSKINDFEMKLVSTRFPGADGKTEVPVNVVYELENLKQTLAKYKNERSSLHQRVSDIVARLDDIIESNPAAEQNAEEKDI